MWTVVPTAMRFPRRVGAESSGVRATCVGNADAEYGEQKPRTAFLQTRGLGGRTVRATCTTFRSWARSFICSPTTNGVATPRPLWTVAPWKITWLGATGSLLRFPRHHQKTISTLAAVAHALVRAASRLFSTPLRPSAVRRQECRRGTHECVRHCSLIVPPQIPALARRRLARVGLWRWAGHTGSRGCSRAWWAR